MDFINKADWQDQILKQKILTESIPSGTERQIVSYDESGNLKATEFTADMWSDLPNGAPEQGVWLAAYAPEQEIPLGFARVTNETDGDTVVLRTISGTVKSSDAIEEDDVITKSQFDSLVARVTALESN